MIKNMGAADRIIRVVIAAILAWLYFTARVEGVLGVILLVVAVVFLLTSVVGTCPLYIPMKLTTGKRQT